MPERPTNPSRSVSITHWLDSDSDGRILLAADAATALADARDYYALDPVARVEPLGWMANVGWDRENYERKRDFVAESGYTEWWESCLPPEDGVATKRRMPAFKVIFGDGTTS